MRPFRYVSPASLAQALAMTWGSEGEAALLGGGTDLLALVKAGLAEPGMVIDLKQVRGLQGTRSTAGGPRIGALTTLEELATGPLGPGYEALSMAAASVGTPQIRHRATLGGNLCQRPRCHYLRLGFRCAKAGGRGCPARDGMNEYLAILATRGSPCVIVHPSDPAVALVAHDARVRLASATGQRVVGIEELFVTPAQSVLQETSLRPGEIVRDIQLPKLPAGTRGTYLKAKDRGAFAFALVSVAAVVCVKNRVIRHARVALGGVAPVPWRARRVEEALLGKRPGETLFREAAHRELSQAEPLSGNGYKVTLAQNAIAIALAQVTR